MSSPPSQPTDPEDQYAELYVDAEEEETEDNDPDYHEDDDDDEDDDERLNQILEHGMFDEEDDDEFHDAEDGGLEVVFEVENDENGEAGEGAAELPEAERLAARQRFINVINRTSLPQAQMLSFLRRTHLGHILFDREDDDLDDEEDGFHHWGRGLRRRRALDPNRFPKVPSEKGRELMESGTFGANESRYSSLKTKKKLARRLLDRELGIGNKRYERANQGMIAQSMVPSSDADMIINYDDNVYSGQFSDDGNFFYSCVKDFRVRMYDTSNPYNWRHYKTVAFPFGSWTLTDASLSPDNKWLAYTSIQSNVCLAPTDPNDTGDPYTLSLSEHGARRMGWRGHFGIWSIRFSGDGRELVAGTNSQSIVIYDIESRRVLHNIHGHEDDVNAVCFADKSSPHILYSGSDDSTIKVWDRRSMGDGREAGAFVGHIEGLTYLDSKDDGRYLLSNGKDQSMKLWDLKMMYTTAQFEQMNSRQNVGATGFDYRWSSFDDANWYPHPNDNSVVTFRGHKVLRTLIRCHFSPPNSTNSRYVYSGSHDGKVYVYNMDATIAGIIDVRKTTAESSTMSGEHRRFFDGRGFPRWSTIVRDASWHPNAPFIAASALNGWDHSLGTVTLHSYNEASLDEGEPRMGTGYDEKLRPMGLRDAYTPDMSEEETEEEDFQVM
ncbi:WD40-repeat-containing domain protein [Xylariomycetidae sp. FL0641]|nr:WD40-repeat-containing domain protein [Xylariomycetidae sp. FL0641]